ncbi:DNA-binding protein SMUBP-2 [Pyricularia oryzae Y34]|uniref:DNA helicase n=1 Tax=Pyricularia oryzae (strain Y34) TaxID=1143189 RepID=A0AA97P5T0_PYRO3|nr:DNA-binding protein SMUBP-2 [Pyricularia oryzae Y34]
MLVAEQVPAFAAAQLSLLAAEQEAEAAGAAELISAHTPAALQRAGAALTNLTVQGRRTGAGGRTVVELSSDPAVGGIELPEHGLRVGDVVLVAEQPAGSAKKREVREMERNGVRGVVTRVRRSDLNVALDAGDDKSGGAGKEEKGLAGRVWVVRLADDVTYRRMTWTMEKMERMADAEHSNFIRVLFGHSSPSPVPSNLKTDPEFGELEWLDPTLNDSQKDAIRFALASKEIALIHGPPGTGKTHTLIELILQMLKQGLRILVCGPSNISVDNIVERLAPHKVPIVRLGHPARLLPSVVGHSLDVLTQTSEAGAIVRDVRAEMDAKQASIKKTKSGRERKAIYGELHELRKEFRDREKRCVANLLQSSKVVLATLHGSGGFQLRQEKFDVVIIDEASQALEAQCWVALLSAKKAVLAGDHLQLPPTIKSLNSKAAKTATGGDGSGTADGEESSAGQSRKKKGVTLETTLFDRLLDLHGPAIKRMLTTQYRMHEKIMRFPSDELYGGRLVAAEAVKERLLKDLPYKVEDTDDTSEPLIFIDTQGGDFPERNDEMDNGDADDKKKTKRMLLHGESKSNEMEAALVAQHVRSLVDAGVKPEDIACITPYNAQLAVLAPLLKDRFPGIELGSVDGFQGREKEAVVVSLCRSNPDGEVGFLGERRRLNAPTRRPDVVESYSNREESRVPVVGRSVKIRSIVPRKCSRGTGVATERGSSRGKNWNVFIRRKNSGKNKKQKSCTSTLHSKGCTVRRPELSFLVGPENGWACSGFGCTWGGEFVKLDSVMNMHEWLVDIFLVALENDNLGTPSTCGRTLLGGSGHFSRHCIVGEEPVALPSQTSISHNHNLALWTKAKGWVCTATYHGYHTYSTHQEKRPFSLNG